MNKKYYIILILLTFLVLVTAVLIVPSKKNIEKGITYIEQFEFEKAIDFFLIYAKENSEDSEAHHYLGKAIKERLFYARYKEISQENESKLFDQAEESFNKSLEINPKSLKARIQLAELYSYKRNYKKALEQYQVIESNGECSSEIYNAIGKVYTELNNIKLAQKYYKLAVGDSFIDNYTKEILSLKITNHLMINNKKEIIISQVKWVILDPLIFNRRTENIKYAEKIIQDIYSPCLSNSLIAIRKSTNNQVNKIEPNVILECSSKKLMVFGIKIKDIKLKLINS